MPIYEYKCEKCGTIDEVLLLKEGDADDIKCSSCASTDMKKIMSAHNTGSSQGGGFTMPSGGCCGNPNSCGMPGSCCGS